MFPSPQARLSRKLRQVVGWDREVRNLNSRKELQSSDFFLPLPLFASWIYIKVHVPYCSFLYAFINNKRKAGISTALSSGRK